MRWLTEQLLWRTIHLINKQELRAFKGCDSLKSIRLPPNLEYIDDEAFVACSSLEAVYLPPTITRIDDQSLMGCTSLRSFYVPETIERIGDGVFLGCDRLLTTVKYNEDDDGNILNNAEVNQWLMQQYANLSFHRACSITSITPQGIEGCFEEHGIERATEVDDQHMTVLHILCANPHVTGDAIRAYLQLAPGAADQEDSGGMTPFQYLCRSDVTFIEDGNLSSLVAWWYHCMP